MKKVEIDSKREFAELETALGRVWEIAGEFGLDPFLTRFEMVPAYIMHEMGAYGIPCAFSHWTRGRAYRQMKTEYDYGLSRVYEMVINSDPSIAYLLETNPPILNMMVMAHVLGHTDFFKNNSSFAPTRRDMPDMEALRASRIAGYEQRQGENEVEATLDAALSIAEHIDPDPRSAVRLSRSEQMRLWRGEFRNEQPHDRRPRDEFEDLLAPSERPREEPLETQVPIPLHPEKDILGFIRDFSPDLTDWKKDIIDIVREESLYFWPQRRTKIINEGWASFWHKRIMREMAGRGYLPQGEDVEWWRLHAGVVAPRKTGLNPYHFGLNMLDYLEEYHNGMLSEEENRWLENNQYPVYPRYTGPYQERPGLKEVFRLREFCDDQAMIRNYFDGNAAARMNMYIYEKQEDDGRIDYVVVEKGWEQIGSQLVASLTNCGFPYIVVKDGDYQGRQELYLSHYYDGDELDLEYLKKTLPYIYRLWGRPVHLETTVNDSLKVFSCDEDGVTME